MYFENISENYPKTYIWEIYLGDQTREMGGYSIPGNSKQFQSWNLKGRGARAHSEIIKMHLWQTGVSARVRIHTKETAMPAQCTIGGEADNESIVCVLPRKHNSVPSMKWYKRRIDYERFPQNWDQEWQQGRMRFLLSNDHVSFTQDEEARAEDEKVGRLESMLSRPQRYEQHPRGGHAQARVQDYIGRPAQKSVLLLWSSGVLNVQFTPESWCYFMFLLIAPGVFEIQFSPEVGRSPLWLLPLQLFQIHLRHWYLQIAFYWRSKHIILYFCENHLLGNHSIR